MLRQPEAFDGWVHQILVRRCYALLRRQRRQRIVTIRALDMDAPAPSEEHRVDAREQIDHAFGRLTPEQRAVLVLTTGSACPTLKRRSPFAYRWGQ